ncbi:MAG: ABC transporter ATP-binding protein [Notoacmeibacter sp.]|nr:ABC transporter ATP-binding protein [Notoacmeibacter sp.]
MALALELDQVSRSYGAVVAVDSVSLDVEGGEFVTLLGPSGSGKTTTLRLIGGFERPNGGAISIAGRRVDHLPPYKRNTATIFQSGALFPHKTVAENIAYGLRMHAMNPSLIRERVGEALGIVQMGGFEERYPSQLSGGQKQRVALARSLALRPSLLLFDEPLSALDLSLRLQLRADIKRLHDELQFTAIYVTHDQSEAMAMSSRVAIMNCGRIEQVAPPQQIYNEPANEFVYSFIGESCCLPVRIDDGAARDQQGRPVDIRLAEPPSSGAWRLYLRPSRIRIGNEAHGCANTARGRVRFTEFLGDFNRYHLVAGGLEFFCDRAGERQYQIGEEVEAGWDTGDMKVFAA